MKINLDKINYYFLTCNNKIRKDHITNEFKNYNLIEVNPSVYGKKNLSAPTGFSRILDQACKDQNRNEPFQPFVIFEDDVKKYRDFPHVIEIPNDTDLFYIGVSSHGIGGSIRSNVKNVCFKNINNDIIKVYNMLSLHGIIVCSIRGLLTLQKCMIESYFNNKVWDRYTSHIQAYLNVYAFKDPLVYQYEKIGGHEQSTKINYNNKPDVPIPERWINKDCLTIITMNNK